MESKGYTNAATTTIAKNGSNKAGLRPQDFSQGRVQPHANEVEQAVLSALMLEKDIITEIIDILEPSYFYNPAHENIYQAMRDLYARMQPIDLLTVQQELKENGMLELCGGIAYIAQLSAKAYSAANLKHYTRIVIEKSLRRRLIQAMGQIGTLVYEETNDVFEMLDQAEQHVFDIAQSAMHKPMLDMPSLVRMMMDELDQRKVQKDGLTGIPSGFAELDRLTSGWQRTELIIVAGRPGMGKTAFVVSSALNSAIHFKKPVAIFSLEMSCLQLFERMLSNVTQIESEKIKRGQLQDFEWQQLHSRIGSLSDAPIFIDDTPAITLLELRAKCRRLKSQQNIELIIIDYLQLMHADQGKNGNREQEIATISRSLKAMAKELNVPVIALAQLSRGPETRGGDKKPMLSDLRESGSIEQDADIVTFLYRPEYYGFTVDESGNSLAGITELIVAKNRSGSPGTIQLEFQAKYTKFTDLQSDRFHPFTNNMNATPASPAQVKKLGSSINPSKDQMPPTKPDGSVPF